MKPILTILLIISSLWISESIENQPLLAVSSKHINHKVIDITLNKDIEQYSRDIEFLQAPYNNSYVQPGIIDYVVIKNRILIWCNYCPGLPLDSSFFKIRVGKDTVKVGHEITSFNFVYKWETLDLIYDNYFVIENINSIYSLSDTINIKSTVPTQNISFIHSYNLPIDTTLYWLIDKPNEELDKKEVIKLYELNKYGSIIDSIDYDLIYRDPIEKGIERFDTKRYITPGHPIHIYEGLLPEFELPLNELKPTTNYRLVITSAWLAYFTGDVLYETKLFTKEYPKIPPYKPIFEFNFKVE